MASSVAVVEWPDAIRDLVFQILSNLATPDVVRCSGTCALFREASKQLTASGSASVNFPWAATQLPRSNMALKVWGCLEPSVTRARLSALRASGSASFALPACIKSAARLVAPLISRSCAAKGFVRAL